jgi:maleate isomerase
MPDVLGYRARIGVVVPSTNTIVEPEFHAMAPAGVTVHTGRIWIGQPAMHDDAAQQQMFDQVNASLKQAIEQVVSCQPDHLVIGMSGVAFEGGREGSEAFSRRYGEMAGLPITVATDALVGALRAFGVRRVATFSPYTQLMSDHSRRFLTESGFEVVRNARIPDCPDALVIAEVDQDRIFAAMREADSPEVEALVQIGANLAMARLVDEAERVHGKPVLGINTVMFWDALRRVGIGDRLQGWGRLLEEL